MSDTPRQPPCGKISPSAYKLIYIAERAKPRRGRSTSAAYSPARRNQRVSRLCVPSAHMSSAVYYPGIKIKAEQAKPKSPRRRPHRQSKSPRMKKAHRAFSAASVTVSQFTHQSRDGIDEMSRRAFILAASSLHGCRFIYLLE